MKKIVFMGSKPIGYYCLSYLIDKRDVLGAEVIAVLTNADRKFGGKFDLAGLAKSNGIGIIPNLSEYPKLGDYDILISIQYHKILKKEHIHKARQIAINLHMAPLPEYRGCNQFSFAIINGDKEFGTTIHRLEEGIDSGAILFEDRFEIPENCFVKELYEITVERSKILFKNNIKKIIDNDYKLKPQKNFLDKHKTSLHYRKEIENAKKIDPNWDAEKIFRYFRATYMPGFEPPYMEINKTKVYLTLVKDRILSERAKK